MLSTAFTAELLRPYLSAIPILPRRLGLEMPGRRPARSLLRGLWGAALHDLAPSVYEEVFEPREPGAVPSYLFGSAPPGSGETLTLDWYLFGPALPHEEILRRAWDVASGRSFDRSRFFVRHLTPLGPDGREVSSGGPWTLAEATWPANENRAAAPCRLRVITPMRLLRDGRLLTRPTLADLTVATMRRVAVFLLPELRVSWDVLCSDLLTEARRKPGVWHGWRRDFQRHSARQDADLELRGVCGVLDLPEGPGELWPLLAAAAWLHIGKATVFGLGRLEVQPWPA